MLMLIDCVFRSRSILNLIQEKQEKQAADLAILKNEIYYLRQKRAEDQEIIKDLKQAASDNAWGVADIKLQQNQLAHDLQTLKLQAERQNETVVILEDMFFRSQQLEQKRNRQLEQIHHGAAEMKNAINQDRTSLERLRHAVDAIWEGLSMSENDSTTRGRDLPTGNNILRSANSNGNVLGSLENSGEGQLSGLEERDNRVEHHINMTKHKLEHKINHHLNMSKKRLDSEVSIMHQEGLKQQLEISKLQTMYLNLSLQMSHLQNKLMAQEKTRSQTELGELQKILGNFTHHML